MLWRRVAINHDVVFKDGPELKFVTGYLNENSQFNWRIQQAFNLGIIMTIIPVQL